MKAVFVNQATVLRDSHIDTSQLMGDWRLMPATLEAMRLLATDDTLLFLYGPEMPASGREGEPPHEPETLRRMAQQIQAGGGRVDGLITCTQQSVDASRCFGDYPGLIWVPTTRFRLRPEHCYLLADSALDVQTALTAGVRPLVILSDRSIDHVLERLDLEKDFPVAVDLTTAVSYIQVEEEITQQLGHARGMGPPMPSDMMRASLDRDLPMLTIASSMAQSVEDELDRNRIRRSDVARWVFFLAMGALGLSLGIAYLLTHLYRVQPFPDFVYYITLQFISRPVRGLLFILFGAAIITVAMRSLLRGTLLRDWLSGSN